MNFKIYIESLNNFPLQEGGVSALMGFRARQANIIFFEEIEEVPTSRMNIVVGCIETTNKYFERLGLPAKMALNIPEEIEEYAERSITYSTMGSLKKGAYNKYPTFVKGNGRAKHFVPGVVKNKEQVNLFFNDVNDNEPILLSAVVDFISEYRAYVCNGEILGIKHYSGDMWTFPRPARVIAPVIDYTKSGKAPAGYSMDFGITNDGRTLLIECNDGWSLGNYGLEDSKYVKLLCARWLELMKEGH